MNKGQIETRIVEKNLEVNPFGYDNYFAVAYNKAERVTSAIYLITKHIPDDEPAKFIIRDIASNILKDIMFSRDAIITGGDFVNSLSSKMRLVLSFLDNLFFSEFISNENAILVKTAYKDLYKIIIKDFSNNTKKLNDPIQISKDFLLNGIDKMNIVNDESSVKNNHTQNSYHTITNTNKQKQNHKKIDTKKTSFNNPQNLSKRMQDIISFIKKSNGASLGELSNVVTSCSSKTLQRDLQKLITARLLVKTGEKRWTKYLIQE